MKHSQLSFSCSTERMEFPKARAQLQRIFHDHTGKVWIIAFSRDGKSHEISPALRSSIKIIVLILGRRISNDFLTRVLIVIIYLVKRGKKYKRKDNTTLREAKYFFLKAISTYQKVIKKIHVENHSKQSFMCQSGI